MTFQGTFIPKHLYTKIERANNLFAALKHESGIFISENYKIKGELNQKTKNYSFLALGGPELPPKFSVFIGEIVYHLRTALDHLVFILAAEKGNPTRLTFPICCQKNEFRLAKRKGALKGVPNSAIQMIESLQPYQTSSNPKLATLYQLHNLNIIDKHRLLLAAAVCVDMRSGGKFLIDAKEDATLILPSDGPPSNIRPSGAGEVVFQFEFAKKPHPDVIIEAVNVFKFKMKFDQMEALMQNREVLPTLAIMRDTVISVIGKICANALQE